MNNVRPSTLAAIVGGALLFIASFLDWFSVGGGGFSISFNLWDQGFQGFFMIVLAIVIVAFAAIPAFAPQVQLPDEILGFSRNQVIMVLGFAAFFLSFAILFRENSAKIGTILSLLASIAVLAGGWMENQGGATAGSSEPPRTI